MNEVRAFDTGGRSSLSKDKLRLWLRLLRAQRGIEAQLRVRLRTQFASTLPRFDVLAALDRYPDGLRMSDLSAHLRVSNGNVTGIVERLVAERLVERQEVRDDRRAFRVRLTAAGRTRFADMAAAHEAWLDERISGVTREEIEAAGTLLARIGREDGE